MYYYKYGDGKEDSSTQTPFCYMLQIPAWSWAPYQSFRIIGNNVELKEYTLMYNFIYIYTSWWTIQCIGDLTGTTLRWSRGRHVEVTGTLEMTWISWEDLRDEWSMQRSSVLLSAVGAHTSVKTIKNELVSHSFETKALDMELI